MKKITVAFLIIVFMLSPFKSVYPYAYSMVSEMLCELGIHFYQAGRYEEALHEFKKALIAQPQYEPAKKYIQMIEEILNPHTAVKEEESAEDKSDVISQYLDNLESGRALPAAKKRQPVTSYQKESVAEKQAEQLALPSILTLEESLRQIHQPIEIEKGSSIVIFGRNIQRFLVTSPDILNVEKRDGDRLMVSGKNIGYSYLHVWDDGGRWTLEFLTTFPKPKGPTLAEELLLDEQKSGAFKLRYAVDWSSSEQGRRLDSLNRQYYAWGHYLGLTGVTPYGNVDSQATVRSLRTTTDLTYLTVGLTDGKFGTLKGFSLRGLDFSPGFSNLASSGISTLRGAMVNSPAFDKKIDYTVFWGRESTGKYGGLSPGLQKMKRSYYEGVNLNYLPDSDRRLGVSVFHGYGRDRLEDLSDYTYDTQADWRLGDWGYHYEAGFDSNAFAHLFSSSIIKPRLKFSYELRDVEKNYFNIAGEPWRRGERGGVFNFNLRPVDALEIYNRLDIYQDRLFPALDNQDRLNEDYDFNANYALNPSTGLRAVYSLQNDLGRVGQSRYQMMGTGISKTFYYFRKFNTYFDYRHKERKNYTNPSSDYIDEDIIAGLRCNLIGRLYYFLNQDWNWLEEKYYGNHSQPRAMETGLDFNSQIGNSPFYEDFRLIYRNEEDTGSSLSFFSGEDYLEGYNELTYRPVPDTEVYLSARVRNTWADNPSVDKRMEVDFNAGMRYLWNTGLRWDSVGSVEGYVFRDLNSDGLRERDEAPVSGIKIILGKNQSATTDIFGYYKFNKVKGKKAAVVIDVSSLPLGFVLTVPQKQEVAIQHGGLSRADFGIIARSEISGIVFYDANNNGKFDTQDQPVKGAQITLENGTRMITGTDGWYYFRNISKGEHTITLLLSSLPSQYLPKVPIVKTVEVTEGIAYYHNIPLKKSGE
jgi:hypothetical protein